jgi:MFS family permease
MENEAGYLPFKQSLLVTICLCFTLFCVSLVCYNIFIVCSLGRDQSVNALPLFQDETILATAIPRITDQFHSLKDVGWYGSSYLFVFTATQMVWGKLYTMYASKWVFLLGVAIFEIGSLICGIAPTSTALIAGRSIAGLGAGSINAGAIVIITDTVPLRKRPIYMGCLGCIHGVVSVSGPM